ncbi:hypothetical protein HanIR_Chr12g0597221 [Helianthus annuus]|nr:hypothetical protein HanIR_Chr12g0597221 [Helianthus annuus]
MLTTPTNVKFICIIYTYEFGFAKLSCFRTSQNANVNEKRDCRNTPTTKRKHQTRVLPTKQLAEIGIHVQQLTRVVLPVQQLVVVAVTCPTISRRRDACSTIGRELW